MQVSKRLRQDSNSSTRSRAVDSKPTVSVTVTMLRCKQLGSANNLTRTSTQIGISEAETVSVAWEYRRAIEDMRPNWVEASAVFEERTPSGTLGGTTEPGGAEELEYSHRFFVPIRKSNYVVRTRYGKRMLK